MAINWDEVRRKAQERGKANEQYIKSIQRAATPSLPRAMPPLPKAQPQNFRNAPALTKITPEQQAKNTNLFLEELRSNQGGVAAGAAGVAAGLVGGGKQYMAAETRQEIEDNPSLSRAFTGGQIAGSIPGFAAPYKAAAPIVGNAVSKIPAVANMGRIGQAVTKSVATDLAVGLPLNANYALNSEGLTGAEAAKSIGINTAIDLITGGILETVPLILKSGKRVASQAEFNSLSVPEKQEAVLMLTGPTHEQKLLTGVNWIEPNRPDFYVNRGGAASPDVSQVQIAGQLPAPEKINPSFNPTRRTIANPYADFNREYRRTVDGVADYIRNYKGKGVQVGVIPKNSDELMRDGVIRYSQSDNDLWYQDFFKEHGRAPLKSEAEDIAKELVDDSLRRGSGEFLNEDLYDLLKYAEYKDTPLPRINKEVPKVIQPPQLPRANRETPFTITRGEMSGTLTKAQPGIPAQASIKPVQPTLPKKGIEAPKEQMFTKNGDFKSVGADTFRPEKSVDELVNKFGAIPKGEQPRAREVDIPKKTDYGDVQQHARTLQESAIVDDTLFNDINDAIREGSFTKPTKSNRTAVENANSALEQSGLDESVNKFRSVLSADKQPTSEDIALGNRVLQELQKQGRYGEAVDVAIDLSQMLSETGRTLQAARIAKRLSPEGRLMYATRIADKITKKTGKKITLSDETIEQISKANTEDEIVKANQKAAVEMWNQTPANWIDKINSWRYMAMLTNPKTHIRNIVGNALFVPAREFKNLIGAGLERALIKDGVRTKAVLNPIKDKAIMDFASNDFANVKSLLKNEGKLDDNIRNLDAKVFNTKVLEGIRKLNLGALDAEDTWFMKFAYDSSLAQYMKANKLTAENMVGEALEAGRKYAMNEALKATYRDFNALANIISRGKANLASGKYGPLGKAGGIALEGMIPFAKTPLNIVKRGVAYSPANLVRGIVNLGRVKSGKVTATEAIDQLASGLSGTALLALGTYLGYNNIVKGKEGEYKDKLYNYNQMLGSQNYSLNIDGKSYTLDWAAPLSMPFFVGVELSKAIKDNNADFAAVLDSMTKISDPIINLSMLKGINDIATNNFEGLGQMAFDIGTGYLGQYNPTLFGQVARTIDPVRRSTISTAETGTERGLEKFGRKQIAKIPIASKKLEPYVDLWGGEQKNAGAVENFLSPGYFKQENITPVDKELQSLIGKLDEETAKKIIPTSTAYQYTIESAGLPYRMTERESTAYQKTRGQESFKGLEKLFKSSGYRTMTQEEKVAAIGKVYSAAAQKAKYEYFDSKGLPVTLALDKDTQSKYAEVKHLMTDKNFYKAVEITRGLSRDIEKAYALQGLPRVPDKLYDTFGISAETVSKAIELKSAGVSAEQYETALTTANTNGNQNVSKAEAMAYLDSTDLDQQKKYALLKALVPNLKDKNNPYY
jgi:hypothetical protein